MTPTIQKKTLALLAIACFAIIAATPVASVLLLVLALHALRGPRETIEAFTIGIFLTLINPALFGSISGAALRWPLIFAGFGRIVWDLTRHQKALWTNAVIPLLLTYSICAVFLAPFVSTLPNISILKGIMFFVGTFTALTAFRLVADERERLQDWFATFYCFLIWGSLPLFFTSYGFAINGTGFQGLTNHPQAFGAFLVSFTAWLTFVLVQAERRPIFLSLTVLLGWYFIYVSQSRTAFLATTGALFITVVVSILRGGTWRETFVAGARRMIIPVLIAVVTVGVLAGPRLVERFKAFALKDDVEEGVTYGEAFEGSRGFLIDQQMANFYRSPIFGIGFGVPSDPENLWIRESGFLGIPAGASVEKGFIASTVVEEMGVVGAVIISLLLLSMLVAVWHQPDPALMALLLSNLFINIGEMIFFSPGALGMYMWMAVGMATMPYIETTSQRYGHRVVYRKPTSFGQMQLT